MKNGYESKGIDFIEKIRKLKNTNNFPFFSLHLCTISESRYEIIGDKKYNKIIIELLTFPYFNQL